MSVLAWLNFYENLLIGWETGVCCLHQQVSILSRLNLEKMLGPSPGTEAKCL